MTNPDLVCEIFDDISGETLKDVYHKTLDLPDGARVNLIISSYGGELLPTISIIETLKRFHTHADIRGFACSAAAILAISCEECSMSENASMLIHSAWSDTRDSDDPGIKRCNELQLNIIRNRCPDFDPKAIKEDTWLSAEDCLKMNLADNIYITDAIDYLATCKRYAARLSNIYNISSTNYVSNNNNTKEITMDEKVNEVVEEVKEEKREEQAEEPKVEEPENHDLLEVVEKLTEELNALKARVLALEEPEVKEEEEVKEEITANCDEHDEERERINNIYKNIMKPQARVAIGTPKAATQKAVHTVDYKAFKSFIND